MDLVLSNKYLPMTTQSLKPKIFNGKVEVLFNEIKKPNKTSIFSLNILGFIQMVTCKYLFY